MIALGVRLSAASDAPTTIARGVTALHWFEYEDANDAFQQARRLDPGLVMAYWGEAMTYHQTLWRNENVQAARDALARLGKTPAARMAKTSDPKEQGYLTAVESLFGDGDATVRRQRYADAMGQLYGRYAEDPDVAAFYALALLGTMSRGLIGTADAHEGHSQALAGSDTQGQVATILGRALRAHPDHPGGLHYLLHDDDDPEHANLALDAARTVARLAPDSSHARHMPSHVFLQLGLWHDAALSDRAAYAASEDWVKRRQLDAALRSYHSLSWLQYELLQLGRFKEAWATLDQIAPVVAASGQSGLLSDLSTMRARYAIETERWDLLARESNFGNANELFAIGMSAARAGNPALAARAREGLADRARDPREGDLRPAIAIMEREVAAVIALGAGRTDEAIAILREAAQAEAQLPPPLGPPQPIKPAPELLGDVLNQLGRGGEAVAPFELALRRNPNRSRSLLGMARAAAAAGQTAAARRHYTALLASFDGADADVPALAEVHAALDGPSAPAGQPRWILAAGASAVIVLIAAVALHRRAKKRGPVARTSRTSSVKRDGRNRRDRKDRRDDRK